MSLKCLTSTWLAASFAILQAEGPGLELKLIQQGLVDVQDLNPAIRVELKYSSPDNFMQADVYGDLSRCYLQPEAAEMLVRAQVLLSRRNPTLFLKVFDGARPRRVQRVMWELVKGTEKQRYVASPDSGSIHNYGSAVDLTIVDSQGRELDMGTPYDFFGDLSQPRFEARFLREGKLNRQQIENRRILKEVMQSAGFIPISNEWWHFDAFPRAVVKTKYKIIE